MGEYKNWKGNVIMMMVIVVVMSSTSTLNCVAQDLSQCAKCVGPYRPCSFTQFMRSCCMVLTPIALSNPTKAAELVCDALINEYHPADKETAITYFYEMISSCIDVQVRVHINLAPKCDNLPTIFSSLPTKCSALIQNPSSFPDPTSSPCCTGVRALANEHGYSEVSAAVIICGVVDFMGDTGMTPNSAFNYIAQSCLPEFQISPDYTHCRIGVSGSLPAATSSV